MPARWPPASSETPLFCADVGEERNQSQTASSNRLYKAYGLLRPFPFGGLLAVGGGSYSPCPSLLVAAGSARTSEPTAEARWSQVSHKGRALLALTSGSLTYKVPRDIKGMEKGSRKHMEPRNFLLRLLKSRGGCVSKSVLSSERPWLWLWGGGRAVMCCA